MSSLWVLPLNNGGVFRRRKLKYSFTEPCVDSDIFKGNINFIGSRVQNRKGFDRKYPLGQGKFYLYNNAHRLSGFKYQLAFFHGNVKFFINIAEAAQQCNRRLAVSGP